MNKKNKIKLVLTYALFCIGILFVIMSLIGKISIYISGPLFLVITIIINKLIKDINKNK